MSTYSLIFPYNSSKDDQRKMLCCNGSGRRDVALRLYILYNLHELMGDDVCTVYTKCVCVLWMKSLCIYFVVTPTAAAYNMSPLREREHIWKLLVLLPEAVLLVLLQQK